MPETHKQHSALPPYNEDAEEAVLGSILIDTDAMLEVSLIGAEDFFIDANQIIFGAMLKIAQRGESINQITVAEELGNKLNDAGGASYFSHLVAMVPTSIHAKHYAQIVKNTAIRRRLISATDQIASSCYNENDPVKILSNADRLLLSIQSSLSVPHLITPERLAELGVDYYGKLRDPANRIAVSTGFEQLDLCTGGLFPGEYWIIAARAGLGKSQVALQIAQNVGKNGPVLIFSLEMHWRQILDRLTAQAVGVPVRKIRGGGYDDDLMSRIYNIALPGVAESNLFLFELGNNAVEMPLVTIPMITSMTRHMKMAYGLSLVIIDYIGLIDAPREDMRSSRAEQVSHISRGIKGLTTSLEVPVIAVAQINREPERRANRRPELSDLRDSGSLEQDADVVSFIYRDDYYDSEAENKGEAEYWIAKQRQGESGIKLMMHWDRDYGRYKDFMY